jgi:hypothetical protein
MTEPRHWMHLLLALGLALWPATPCAGASDGAGPVSSADGCVGQADCCCGPADDDASRPGRDEVTQKPGCPCALPLPFPPETPSSPTTVPGTDLREVLTSPTFPTWLEPGWGRLPWSPCPLTRPRLPCRQLFGVRLL